LQFRLPILIDLPLLFINKSIFITGTPINSPLYLSISSLRRNLKKEFLVNHPEIRGLGVQLIFNKNVIELGDNKKYIKEAVDIIAILYVKQEYNYKDDIPVYFKASLNRIIYF